MSTRIDKMGTDMEKNTYSKISIEFYTYLLTGFVLSFKSSCGHGIQAIIQTHKQMTNRNVQTNRHGPQNKGCNQASVDSKHYLVSKLRPPCP